MIVHAERVQIPGEALCVQRIRWRFFSYDAFATFSFSSSRLFFLWLGKRVGRGTGSVSAEEQEEARLGEHAAQTDAVAARTSRRLFSGTHQCLVKLFTHSVADGDSDAGKCWSGETR